MIFIVKKQCEVAQTFLSVSVSAGSGWIPQTRISVPLRIIQSLCIVFCLLSFIQRTNAQSPDPKAIRYGVYGGYMWNQHQVGFTKLEGLPSCCDRDYQNTTSQGWYAGALAEFPLVKLGESATFGFAARAQYLSGLGANLRANTSVDTRGAGGSGIVKANIEHRFNPQLSTVSVEPMLTLRLVKWLSIYAGIQAGTWLQSSFSYEERILSPNNIVFENDKTSRNEQTGNIPNMSPLQLALVGGISYELPVTRSGTILPTLEAFYTYALNSPVSGVNWRVNSVRAGLSLRFSPNRTTDLTAQEVEEKYQDSIRIAKEATAVALADAKEAKKKQLDAKINTVRPVFFDDDDGSPSDTSKQNIGGAIAAKLSLDQFELTVQKVAYKQAIELLPMLFFNENSSVFPVRYKTVAPSDAAKFSIDAPSTLAAIQKSPLNAYYQLLNVVGKRLQANPSAKITLTGVATEKEQDGSFMADALAARRAQAVSNYLQDNWRINANRITTKSRIATGAEAKGNEADMRRVELSASEAAILDAVQIQGVKRVVTPPGLQIGLQIAAGQGLKQWDLDVSQSNGLEVATLGSATGGANYPERYVVDFRQNPPVSAEDIAIRLSIDDVSNNKFESPIMSVKVKEAAQDGTVLSLVVLQGASPLVKTLVPAMQGANAQAVIRTQSKDVASGIAQALTAGAGQKAATNITQKIVQKPLYDTNNPEARFYNAGGTVEVK